MGGGVAGILRTEALFDTPRLLDLCDLNNYCSPSRPYVNRSTVDSTNVNGPGSGNVRVYPFDIITSATRVIEIQVRLFLLIITELNKKILLNFIYFIYHAI